jgi:TIR domain/PAN domain
MVDVVILSSREDEELVRPIAEQATSLGLELWRSDSTSDSDGAHDKDICATQIGRSGVVLVCWSDRAVASKSVLAEASDALWQQKLVACRLSPCEVPSPFGSIPIRDLIGWDGRIDVPAFSEIVAAVAEKLRRPGLVELLRARVSGDENALYCFATRFSDEPQARPTWAAFEAKYREECASIIREGRRYLEQRVASHQQKIEHTLKFFADDFQAWLERERRGEASPKPSLKTLLDIWLRRKPDQKPDLEAEPVAVIAATSASAGHREAEVRVESPRSNEDAEAALERAKAAEAQLAEARAKLAAVKIAPPPTTGRGVLAGATLSAFALGMLISPILHPGRTTTQALAPAKTSEPKELLGSEPSGQAGVDMGNQKSSSEVLQELLEAHRDETMSRVIGFDPQAALSKLLDIAPENVVRASASRMPTLAASEALKASMSEAVAPLAQLPPGDLFKALKTTLPSAKISELAKLFAPPAQSSAPSPVSGANYKTFDNMDIESSGVTKLKSGALENCISACRQQEGCRGYTFDKWNRICFLKSELGAFKLNPRSSSGVREDTEAPRKSTSSIIIERYPMKAFPGLGYKAASAANPELCESACEGEEACIAYTFHFVKMQCNLFKTTGEYFSDSFAVSGGKRQ